MCCSKGSKVDLRSTDRGGPPRLHSFGGNQRRGSQHPEAQKRKQSGQTLGATPRYWLVVSKLNNGSVRIRIPHRDGHEYLAIPKKDAKKLEA